MSVVYSASLDKITQHQIQYPAGGVIDIENSTQWYLYLAIGLSSGKADIINQNRSVIPPFQHRAFRANFGQQAAWITFITTDQPFAFNQNIAQSAPVVRVNEYGDPKAFTTSQSLEGLAADYIVIAGGRILADQRGLFELDAGGNPVLAIAAIDGVSWDGGAIDRGDVLIGTRQGAGAAFIFWDNSLRSLTIQGIINVLPGGDAITIADVTNQRLVGLSGSFTSTGADSISWAGLSLRFADNHVVTIPDGSLSGIAALTYLYVINSEVAGSQNLLNATTIGGILGDGLIIAIAQNGADKATIQVVAGRTTIAGDWIATGSILAANIKAGTITANEIAANTITAAKIAANTIQTTNLIAGFKSFINNANPLNALINPGFEAGSVYWVASGAGATWSAVNNAANAHSGNFYAAINQVAGGAALLTACDETSTGGFYEVSPGDVVMFTGWGKVAAGDALCRIEVVAWDKDKNFVSQNLSGTFGSGSYTQKIITYTAAATVKYITVRANISGGTIATTFWLDDLTLALQIPGGGIVAASITTSQLTATAIDGMTITGATIQTATSGARTVLNTNNLSRFLSGTTVAFDKWIDTDNKTEAGINAFFTGTTPNKNGFWQIIMGDGAGGSGYAGEQIRIGCDISGLVFELTDAPATQNTAILKLPTATGSVFKIQAWTTGTGTDKLTINSAGDLQTAGKLGVNGKTAQAAFSVGAAAPAGGTGTTAGAWDTAAHRDAAITLINNLRTALINMGIAV